MEQNLLNAYNKAEKSTTSAFAVLMKQVYIWMTLGLAMTGLTAYYVAGNPGWLQVIFSGNTYLFLFLAELGLVFYLSSRISSMSITTAGIMFAIFSILNGVVLSSIFVVYELGSIASTFFVTAGTFGAMSLFGYFTKRDLSAVGRFLFMALIGLIIASIVNWFMQSPQIYWITTYAGVLIFSGLTAYDTQKIKQMFIEYGGEVNEGTMKLALLGSLTLYLDFINLFLYFLRARRN